MVEQDLHFYLRLNADEFPYIAHESWLVSGSAYRGRYVDPAGAMRRRVRLYHPEDERQTVVLHADQLEPEVYPWTSPAHSAAVSRNNAAIDDVGTGPKLRGDRRV